MKSGISLPTTARAQEAESALSRLQQRVGAGHFQQRLDREAQYERAAHQFGSRFFHLESWCSVHSLIRTSLRLVGLHGRARRNALAVETRTNDVRLPGLARALDGYTLLQISDPHVDMSPDTVDALIESVHGLSYDVCVLTGDYRTRTFGPYQPTLSALARLRPHLKGPTYAVLGNHDTLRLVPGMETLGIQVLLNEVVNLDEHLSLAGIDDAHYYRLHDFDKVARAIPSGVTSILLSHTPEAYRDAEQAGFNLMLSGHTHGGQICLPGGFPLITDTRNCPRRYAKGAWQYGSMAGYTSTGSGASIVDVRLNCPPEVTLHRLVSV